MLDNECRPLLACRSKTQNHSSYTALVQHCNDAGSPQVGLRELMSYPDTDTKLVSSFGPDLAPDGPSSLKESNVTLLRRSYVLFVVCIGAR
jgi:hypothetical protein